MRITKYNVVLTKDRNVSLVKEKGFNYHDGVVFNQPYEIVKMVNQLFQLDTMAEEYVYMVGLSTSGKILGIFEISHGIVNMALANPREIFIRALLVGAAQIVILHNHPSGSAKISEEDITITKRIKESGKLLGIPLADHIIIGDSGYSSFADKGMM